MTRPTTEENRHEKGWTNIPTSDYYKLVEGSQSIPSLQQEINRLKTELQEVKKPKTLWQKRFFIMWE
jgi:uncharacterized small protein (DUF1192 family)